MPRRWILLVGGGLFLTAALVAWAGRVLPPPDEPAFPLPELTPPEATGPVTTGPRQATFGCGCFWCAEAVFQRLNGVEAVVPGYSGGTVESPTYAQVCSGTTGHAEAVQLTYDPRVISYAELLEVFWRTHDPTTPNRQGADAGMQYRSVILYHDDEQRRLAERYKARIDEAGVFQAPVVTEIVPFRAFYPAEAYHRDYFNEHPRQPYCALVIGPKVEKLRKVFQGKLKD
jgi:peptide-methionine (S)-S-oxide reductase